MDNTVAGTDIGGDDLRHGASRIASSLLEDSVSSGVSKADGTGVSAVSHLDKSSALKVVFEDYSRDDVVKKDISEKLFVGNDSAKGFVTKISESIIGWSEDGKGSSAQSLPKTSLHDGSTESGEVFKTAGDFSCKNKEAKLAKPMVCEVD